jgi:hypothetical protein
MRCKLWKIKESSPTREVAVVKAEDDGKMRLTRKSRVEIRWDKR